MRTPTARGADLLTEDQLLDVVLSTAHLYGWRVVHFRAAMTARSYRTAVSGDGAGFLDLFCVHPRHGVMVVELKTATGTESAEQAAWVRFLEAASVPAMVWRPRDWTSGFIERAFREGLRR